MSNKTVVGGWYAINNGFEPGKQPEIEITQIQGKNGGIFNTFEVFKPFQIEDRNQGSATQGQQIWVRGRSFPVNMHMQVVDRINYMIQQGFTEQQGIYVFQPQTYQQPMQQPAQQQMGQQGGYPQQAQGYAAAPQPQAPQPPVSPQTGGQYIPPQGGFNQ